MTGRPSIFTDDLAAKICKRIAEGESLRAICEDDQMPHRDTVRGWLASGKYPEFSAQYARAREEQADHYADEIVEIADSTEGDHNRDRLRIDARKWKASKLAPKKYGDKVAHVGGDEGDSPIRIERIELVAPAMTPDGDAED